MHKCLFALTAALDTSALGARGSRKSALCCRSKAHTLSPLGLAAARSRDRPHSDFSSLAAVNGAHFLKHHVERLHATLGGLLARRSLATEPSWP